MMAATYPNLRNVSMPKTHFQRNCYAFPRQLHSDRPRSKRDNGCGSSGGFHATLIDAMSISHKALTPRGHFPKKADVHLAPWCSPIRAFGLALLLAGVARDEQFPGKKITEVYFHGGASREKMISSVRVPENVAMQQNQ